MSATFTATVAAWLTGGLSALADGLFDQSYVEGPLGAMASVIAVALAAVFAFAAATKITSPSRTTTEFEQLLVPAPKVLARVVPLAELLVAMALIIWPRIGATLAATLLGAFTALLVVTVRSGRSVSCGCLGARSTEPVTMATVARNFALLAMALVALTIPALTMPDLASLLVLGSLAVLATMIGQLVVLRHTLGRIWSVELAGESSAQPLSRDTKGMTA